MANKRRRTTEDVDGDEEIEIESASSSFRQSNKGVKRNQTALARELGQNDRGDLYDDLLQSPDDTDQDEEPERPESPQTIDTGPDDTMHNADSAMEEEEDEIDEMGLTQHIGKKFKEKRDNMAMEEGIIEEVFCTNFMCHSKLRVGLGPNINFIIGHNGSGKSAVLTALTMCLGGRATQANRGKSLKDMIKHGKDSAILGVKVKNQGENAYKSEIYGRSITVERHFTKSGSSGFKLKNSEGKIISTKRGDLDDILDYFGLQMDNPINVLTQDMARQFLSNSSAAEKYKFFLRGTQLEALDADYKMFEESLDGMQDKLRLRGEDIAVLKEKFDAAEKRKQRADNIERVRTKMIKIQRQCAWAQVEREERVLQGMEEDVVEAEKREEEAEGAVQTIDGEFDSLEAEHDARERVAEQLSTELPPAQEKHQLEKQRFDANKSSLLTLQAEQREMKDTWNKAKRDVARLGNDIEAEQSRLSEAGGSQHLERENELETLKAELTAAEKAEEEHASGLQGLQNAVARAAADVNDADKELKEAERASQNARQGLRDLEGNQRNRFGGYAQNMDKLLREIDRDTRWERKPVGPTGMRVHLLKPEWSSILEKTFGGQLNSFVVVHKNDQMMLSQMARRVNCNIGIVLNNPAPLPALHEPAEEDSEGHKIDTILRVLKFDDEEVRKTLIIHNAVDQTVLIKNNDRASSFFQKNNANVKAVLAFAAKRDCGIRFDWSRAHAVRSSPIDAWTGSRRMQADIAEQQRAQQRQVDEAARDADEAKQRHRRIQNEHHAFQQAVARHTRTASRLLAEKQQKEDDVEAKKAEIEEYAPQEGRLHELQHQLDDAKEEKRKAQEALEDSYAAKTRLDETAKGLKTAMDAAQAELNEVTRRIQEAQDKVKRDDAVRHEKLLEKNAVHEELDTCKETTARLQEKVDAQKERLQLEFIDRAQEICARVDVPEGETVETLTNKWKVFEDQIKAQERDQGGTREELTRAWKEASDELQKAKNEIRELTKLARTLKDTLKERHRRWGLFRKYISARSRITFQYLLSERQFRGRVLIDHTSKKLDISVEPDLSKRSDAGRQARTLSGGEKSFSQICLLLSIWEAMGSPIRCLDEFDVFMDSVNRQQSMTLLIDAARRAVGRQFILISPQAMQGVELGEDVRVHKMGDPERGQTNLNFNGQEL